MTALREIVKIKIESKQCTSCPDGHLHKQVDYLLKAFYVLKELADTYFERADACDNGGDGREGQEAVLVVNKEFEERMKNEQRQI